MTYVMKKSEGSDKEWELCPAGMQQMVLCDILDLGWELVSYEGKKAEWKPKVKLIWQSVNVDSDGHRILVFDFGMVLSFNEKSSLYKRLAAWLGKNALEEMLNSNAAFDSLIGQNALVNIEHVPSKKDPSRIFANISSIAPLMAGMTPIAVEQYERLCERDTWEDRKPSPSAYESFTPPPVNPDSNYERAQALPSVAPAPVQPTPAPTFEPISGKLTVDLFKIGHTMFGDKADEILDQQALELTRNERKLADLTNDEGIQLKDKLRNFSPAKAMEIKATATAAANTVPDADDDSIFDGE